MQNGKSVIAIIDNSISFTGAFKCALTEARLLQSHYHFIFIVPQGSKVIKELEQAEYSFYTLPFLEISKSSKALLYVPRLVRNTYRLKKILKKENVSVLQVNDFYNLLGAAAKLSGFKGALITYVRFLPQAIPAVLRKFWISVGYRYSNAVVAVSDAVLKQLPQHRKLVRIYDAVSLTEKLQPVQTAEAPQPEIIFLYLANYIRGKGQDHALTAFKKASEQNSQLLLKFAGGDMGLEKNRQFKQELEQYVLANGLSEKVTFETFQTDIEATIKASDVVLNFSEAESFSMTCAEASFYGMPVIATRCGGPEEVIVHGKTGLLVANKNIQEMTEAMLVMAGDKKLRATYGAGGRQFIRMQFSEEKFVAHLSALLKKVMKPKHD